MFVIINLTGQIGGSVLVMARKYVEIACGILLGIILLQVSYLLLLLVLAEGFYTLACRSFFVL